MPEDKIKNLKPEMGEEVRCDENAACEVCGKFGAYKFGERLLCADCYQESGSCCAGEFQQDNGE